MSMPGTAAPGNGALELPPFSLDVQALDLGGDVKAVALEGNLSKWGLNAYQPVYAGYTFCAICEPEDGWVTLLSESLWPSEVIRRVRPAVERFDIHIARPN